MMLMMTTTPRRHRPAAAGSPPSYTAQRQRRQSIPAATQALLLLLLLLGPLGAILGAAGAPEGAYDDDHEGAGGSGSGSSSNAPSAAVLARRSHRLIGGGADGPSDDGASSVAVAGGAGGGSGSHEAYAAARQARMPLELFTRVLHTPAEGELAGEEGLLHDALDFQWRLLAASPAKPAPYLVCGAYGQGACVWLICDRSIKPSVASNHTDAPPPLPYHNTTQITPRAGARGDAATGPGGGALPDRARLALGGRHLLPGPCDIWYAGWLSGEGC